MDNHIHLIVKAPELSDTLASFKKFTAKEIIDQLKQDNKQWLLSQLAFYKKKYKAESDYNVYHVMEEFSVERAGGKEEYRPDIVLFVNGIPLAVIECKRSDLGPGKDAIEQAISQHIRNQKDDGREVFGQDRALYSLCRPERLLELAYRYIIYDAGEKKIARYQQHFCVKNIMNRIRTFDDEGKRVGGVVWHTQGSGQSLTMVMLAKAIALELSIENHKITDRIDLDDQIYKTFHHCSKEVEQARTGKLLMEMIEGHKERIKISLSFKERKTLKITVHPDKMVTVDAPKGKKPHDILYKGKRTVFFIDEAHFVLAPF